MRTQQIFKWEDFNNDIHIGKALTPGQLKYMRLANTGYFRKRNIRQKEERREKKKLLLLN